MKKYPSTEQFRNIVKRVRDNHDYHGVDSEGNPIYGHLSDYPKLTFKGTVKLHGTNAAVVKYKNDGRIEFQSRERVLTIQNDNAAFALNMANKNLDFLFEDLEFNDFAAIYGEWCGGNIQKGVALNGLEISQKSTGKFLRWVVNDVFKEEEDTIVKNQLDIKKINSNIANKAKVWFFNNL